MSRRDGLEKLLRPDRPDPTSGRQWARLRREMERHDSSRRRRGPRGQAQWRILEAMAQLFRLALLVSFQYRRGVRNAYDLQVRRETLELPTLPEAFESLRILHMTDLHLDGMDGLAEILQQRIEQVGPVDLALLTGDYKMSEHGPSGPALEAMRDVVSAIDSREGTFAVLGNHDSVEMVDPLREMGVQVLVNGSHVLPRGEQQIRIVGTDDVHYYYTPAALRALDDAGEGFTIAMVHSPELAPEAARCGVDLYLCGHTHGGQVCLPGGRAVLTHLTRCRKLYRGLWRLEAMLGRTGTGVGTSSAPIRFQCPPELAVLTLRGRQEA